MKVLESLDGAIAALKGQKDLTFLLGDWDEGVQLEVGVDDARIVTRLESARKKYGDRLSLRAFNESIDVYWNGEGGSICTDACSGSSRKMLLLETDFRRFRGVGVFWPEDYSEPLHTHVEVEEIRRDGRVVHLRMLRLCREKGE